MDRKVDYYKAAAILIKDRKVLLTHEQGKKFYVSPGGVIEKGETPEEAVIRELREEVNLVVDKPNLEFFGTFYAPTAGVEDTWLRMDVYTVLRWSGEPIPSSGEEVIDDILWANTKNIPSSVKVGSIFEHEVMPRLKKLDLID